MNPVQALERQARPEIEAWLKETRPEALAELYAAADQTRRAEVGDEVHLRGLIEISNRCDRQCLYCGLRAGNDTLTRYTMTRGEILACARQAQAYGYGTVVLQSGEDAGLDTDLISELIQTIKRETALAVTLSLGERAISELERWKAAGADRYLLRFETSNLELYAAIHPGPTSHQHPRVQHLRRLRELGYELGSGVMVGIPGQTYADLVNDLLLFKELELDMIGLGPWIAHAQTPLGRFPERFLVEPEEQVPASEDMVYKLIALTRLACPGSNIPATTALATINARDGRELGLQRGANIVMPIMTPVQYRRLYEIYPDKACADESSEDCRRCLTGRILRLGRTLGSGRGDSRRSITTKRLAC